MSFPKAASLERTPLPRSQAPSNWGFAKAPAMRAIAGWVETKLGSYRVQDRADVVQVIKVTTPASLRKIRKQLGKAHTTYVQRFDEHSLEAA